MKRLWFVVALAMVLGAGAFAQDVSLAPTYGDVELEYDFRPDPYIVQLEAGGPINLEGMGYFGYVYDAPDVDLYYTAGPYSLTIKVQNAGGDTILLVNSPDGEWHFNDDTNGLDPAITFQKPASGLYDIWIGTVYEGEIFDAQVAITEMD